MKVISLSFERKNTKKGQEKSSQQKYAFVFHEKDRLKEGDSLAGFREVLLFLSEMPNPNQKFINDDIRGAKRWVRNVMLPCANFSAI